MGRRLSICIIGIVFLCWCGGEFACFAQPQNQRLSRRPVHRWRIRTTTHFQIMYREKYIDAEEVYLDLSEELNKRLKYVCPKTKIFIQEGNAFVDLGKRKIVVANRSQLRQGLTRLLLYQSSKNTPNTK